MIRDLSPSVYTPEEEMAAWHPEPPTPEWWYKPQFKPLVTFSQRHEDAIAWAWLSIELIGKFALCVASIVMGCSIALHSQNEGYTILAALAVALIIGWAFGRERQ